MGPWLIFVWFLATKYRCCGLNAFILIIDRKYRTTKMWKINEQIHKKRGYVSTLFFNKITSLDPLWTLKAKKQKHYDCKTIL